MSLVGEKTQAFLVAGDRLFQIGGPIPIDN